MEGKPGVVDALNKHLTVELTAINTYFLQSEMCKNWGYNRLAAKFRALSMEEMTDVEPLVNRILFLEGLPNMQRINQIVAPENVLELLQGDLELEKQAVSVLQEGIGLCESVGDYTTRSIFEEMIKGEEEHVDWFETQLETIEQVGMQNYLSQHINE